MEKSPQNVRGYTDIFCSILLAHAHICRSLAYLFTCGKYSSSEITISVCSHRRRTKTSVFQSTPRLYSYAQLTYWQISCNSTRIFARKIVPWNLSYKPHLLLICFSVSLAVVSRSYATSMTSVCLFVCNFDGLWSHSATKNGNGHMTR